MTSLRVRLLMASIGLVLVALVVSGVLSVLLVERLETTSTQDQLTNTVGNIGTQVVTADTAAAAQQSGCGGENSTNQGAPGSHPYPALYLCELQDRLQNVSLTGDQALIVISGDLTVLYSSQGDLYQTEKLASGTLGFPHRRNVPPGDPSLSGTGYIAGQPYLYAVTPVEGVHAAWVVLTVPLASVNANAARVVIPPVLEAAGAALILAIAVSLLLSRALIRPLTELEQAAGDIAAGNYSRRAKVEGPREVSVVTESFNRMAEAVETSRAQQRNFLADVSHELKTPLTSLIGFSQAMTDGSLPEGEPQRRAAAIVNEEAQRVLALSQALLDLARAESGQLEYHLGPVDLGAMLQQAVTIVQPRATARNLQIQLRLPSLPPVAADHERLVQVIENLVDNAVRYAPPDARIEIAANATADQVVVDISNPIGEHRPDLDRIFDRFYRADPARSSAKRGAGLGLAISRRLVRGQRGDLTAWIDRWDRIHLTLVLDRSTGNRLTIEAQNPLVDEAEAPAAAAAAAARTSYADPATSRSQLTEPLR
ncbi:MAG: HAMP domain-containing histidine kinase [Candidatus Dormibacteraeota bacterium]|nr:HAMP domain-containing histidine kinase [Candidatus Dormibacteraeota bacterium]